MLQILSREKFRNFSYHEFLTLFWVLKARLEDKDYTATAALYTTLKFNFLAAKRDLSKREVYNHEVDDAGNVEQTKRILLLATPAGAPAHVQS